jgi:hypothetical protein
MWGKIGKGGIMVKVPKIRMPNEESRKHDSDR